MEKRQPWISVVMPVYNVEKHLKKAVQSILDQSIQDFEIILVDDHSPDGCPSLCEKLAASDERIRVIHHEVNQGLSMARNTGLKEARGKYIWFMDSDDYVDDGLFEMVKESLKINPAEIVVIGLTEDYYDENNRLHHSETILPEQHYFAEQDELREYIIELEKKTLYGYAWNKIYDLDYLKDIGLQFEKITLIEDILFNVKYCMKIQKMNVVPYAGYHYNKRMDNSLTSKFVPEYYKLHKKRIDLIYRQYETWNKCSGEIRSVLGALYTRYIFSAVQRNCDKRANMNFHSRKKWIQRMLNEQLVQELIPYAETEGILLKVMILLMKRKCTYGILLSGRFIFVCKNKLPLVFAVLKQKR